MLGVFDRAAEDASNLVRSYHHTLVALYSTALQEPAPTAGRNRVQMAEQVQQAEIALLGALAPKLQTVSEEVVQGALAAANPQLGDTAREELKGSVTDARNQMLGVLTVAMLKDAEDTNKALRNFALQVDLHMNARRITYAAAVSAAKAQEGHLAFSQMDRGGKRWGTINYVATTVRGFMVKTYVESYLYGLGHAGEDLAKVVYPENPQHAHNETVFSITGSSAVLPAYKSLRDEIWHPNSRALVSKA